MTEATLAFERSRAVVFRNLFREQSELLKVGRYELVRTLGRGGMGVVYEAFDPRHCERVALKMLHSRSPAHLYRLKREFRALAGISHPNLVAMRELCVSQQNAFFTMELVAGNDIVSYVRHGARGSGSPDRERRLRSAFIQLGQALRRLHAAGKLHLDLKPANVVVTETGRVVLLDFGLAQDAQAEQVEIAGTPPYTAPEQYQGRACPGSDRYGFGCILHEALHGRPPAFDRRGCVTPVPRLARLASDLVDPDPTRRPSWDAIMTILSGTESAGCGTLLAGASSVQRDPELAALERAFRRSKSRPVLVALGSGADTASLVHQFVQTTLRKADALVLRARCHAREIVPYNALDGIVDALSQHLLDSPQVRLEVLRTETRAALLRAFPVLGRVPFFAHGTNVSEPLDATEQRRRTVCALKRLFALLGAERPLVLCIDDLQCSDADSRRLLDALLCDEDGAGMLVIGTSRSAPGGGDRSRACDADAQSAATSRRAVRGDLARLTPEVVNEPAGSA